MPSREQIAAALKYVGEKANLRQRFERAISLDPQEQDIADIAVETGASFIPGVGQALAARDVERARRANDPAGMAMASMGAIPGGRLAGLLKRYDPVMQQLDVYHGTPHKFPATETNPLGEFDASKIGTGEGAQAYGHGVYLAEAPQVAEGYKKTISQSMTAGAQRRLQDAGGDLDKAIADTEARAAKYRQGGAKSYAEVAEEDLRGLRQFKEAGEWTSGSLYKADLPDEMIDRMLDWDKPLSEQSPAVRKSLKDAGFTKVADDIESAYLASLPSEARELALKMINGPYEEVISHDSRKRGANLHAAKNWDELERLAPGIEHNEIFRIRNWYANKNAPDFYSGLSQKSDQEASERLRQAGIMGIKYLDAGSRGQGGSGTRNFVVFPGEEKKVRILERK
jgi:hypothetical protein